MKFAIFSKLSVSDYVYIVGIIVILFFAIAFITLAIFFFNSKKRTIIHKIDDEEIQLEIEQDVKKISKKNQSNEDIAAYYKKKEKKNKIIGRISTSVITGLYIAVIAFIAFSVSVKKNNQQMWFGNTAMLVIETDSMSQVYKGNTYLQDAEKISDENRIAQYSFITITKEEQYIDNIQPFDIVAFQMLSNDNKTYITVVHRLIEVTYNAEGEPLYTFRGDANPKSMAGEFQIKKDRIVGVYETEGYKGIKSLALGYAICYLQSNIGIIISVIAFMLMLIYSILVEKLFGVYDQRYHELLALKLDSMGIEIDKKREDETSLEIKEAASKEEIEKRIEEISEENHIQKENMMVKKGRIYYRDAYGRFMSLNDYLKIQKGESIIEVKEEKSMKIKKSRPQIVSGTRPRDAYGRYVKIEGSQELSKTKNKVGGGINE